MLGEGIGTVEEWRGMPSHGISSWKAEARGSMLGIRFRGLMLVDLYLTEKGREKGEGRMEGEQPGQRVQPCDERWIRWA